MENNNITKNTKSKTWFLTIANPKNKIDENKTEEELCEWAVTEWCKDNSNRSAMASYSISENGFEHMHLCICDKNSSRYSAVQKVFPYAHIEVTKGTKKEAEDYIYKRGNYRKKGENVIYSTEQGEIIGRQGHRSDLDEVQKMLDDGYTPEEIFAKNIRFRKYEKSIRDAFFQKKSKNTPYERDVKVYWHVGESETGKSHVGVSLREQFGRNNVYTVVTYKSGPFDLYDGEDILILDELRDGFDYQLLLNILDKYTNQIPCRYSNKYMLWREVHITSVLPPEGIYKLLNKKNDIDIQEQDTFKQLKRRITEVIYHYVEKGEYKEYRQSSMDYTTYDDLKNKAEKALVEE